jgi:hypothetical protein
MALCSEYTIFFTSSVPLQLSSLGFILLVSLHPSVDMSPCDEFCIGEMELARLANGRLTSVVTSFQDASDPYPRFRKLS